MSQFRVPTVRLTYFESSTVRRAGRGGIPRCRISWAYEVDLIKGIIVDSRCYFRIAVGALAVQRAQSRNQPKGKNAKRYGRSLLGGLSNNHVEYGWRGNYPRRHGLR